MRMHPRERIVQKASSDLRKMLLGWFKISEELTTAEEIMVLSTVMHDLIGGALKMAIRQERHGTTDVPGGIDAGTNG